MGSSEHQAAARPPPPDASWDSHDPRPVTCPSQGNPSTQCRALGYEPCAALCNRCFRTRTRRSTHVAPLARASPNRWGAWREDRHDPGRACRGSSWPRGVGPGVREEKTERVKWRAETANCPGPSLHAQPSAPRAGRTSVLPRHAGGSPDRQPPPTPQEEPEPDDASYHARPPPGSAPDDPRGGHAPRPNRRIGSDGRAVLRATSPVHARAVSGRGGTPRSVAPGQDQGQGGQDADDSRVLPLREVDPTHWARV